MSLCVQRRALLLAAMRCQASYRSRSSEPRMAGVQQAARPRRGDALDARQEIESEVPARRTPLRAAVCLLVHYQVLDRRVPPSANQNGVAGEARDAVARNGRVRQRLEREWGSGQADRPGRRSSTSVGGGPNQRGSSSCRCAAARSTTASRPPSGPVVSFQASRRNRCQRFSFSRFVRRNAFSWYGMSRRRAGGRAPGPRASMSRSSSTPRSQWERSHLCSATADPGPLSPCVDRGAGRA